MVDAMSHSKWLGFMGHKLECVRYQGHFFMMFDGNSLILLFRKDS